jgi:hypothetical protein
MGGAATDVVPTGVVVEVDDVEVELEAAGVGVIVVTAMVLCPELEVVSLPVTVIGVPLVIVGVEGTLKL